MMVDLMMHLGQIKIYPPLDIYMTPETAQLGLNKLKQCKDTIPERWDQSNYPYLPSMSVFK